MKRIIGVLLVVLLLPLAGCIEPPATDKDKGKEKDKKPARLKELVKEDLKEGEGDEAKSGDKVKVHYTGTLRSDGSKFDSSLDSGKPFVFTLGRGQVIEGWDKGVAGMKVGGKRRLEVPARMAYGADSPGPEIPPNSDLVFEVELLEIVK